MFAFNIDRRKAERTAGGRARGLVLCPRVARAFAAAQAVGVVLVAGVRLLCVRLGVPQFVELPSFLDERGAVLLALLPQRRGDA